MQGLVKMDGQVGRLAEIRPVNIIKGCGVVLETMWARGREIWNKGAMEEEWSEAGTNDGCAQGHTSTAVSPPNFSNVRSA